MERVVFLFKFEAFWYIVQPPLTQLHWLRYQWKDLAVHHNLRRLTIVKLGLGSCCPCHLQDYFFMQRSKKKTWWMFSEQLARKFYVCAAIDDHQSCASPDWTFKPTKFSRPYHAVHASFCFLGQLCLWFEFQFTHSIGTG